MPIALLPIQLGEIWLAVEAAAVEEILGMRDWIPIPGAIPTLPGVAAWRGRAVAVLDLGALEGIGDPLESGRVRRRTVLVEVGGNALAVPVDAVREVEVIEDEQLKPLHGSDQRFASFEVEIDGMPVPLLNLVAIVEAIEHQSAAAT
jgi:chemotaxis signal transduction protein